MVCGVLNSNSYEVVSRYLHHISYTKPDESSRYYEVLFLEIISSQMGQSDDLMIRYITSLFQFAPVEPLCLARLDLTWY